MTRKMHIRKSLLNSSLLLSLLLFSSSDIDGHNEEVLPFRLSKVYFPVNEQENLPVDKDRSLFPFFAQLKKLSEHPDSSRTVSIIHIGDSHIQADFTTAVIRTLFQDYFGNAGRGLVIPLKLAGTNEPGNYGIISSRQWKNVKCIRSGTIPIGIGGLTLFCSSSETLITVETYDKSNSNVGEFDRVTLFYDAKQSQIIPSDSSLVKTQYTSNNNTYDYILNAPTTSFSIYFHSNEANESFFFGANLRNGKNGILYHGIGINGARYTHYADQPLFFEQIALLNASLVIVSLGTNEAYDRNFNTGKFYANIDKMIGELRQSCPDAAILLTTPAETWLRNTKKRFPNPRISSVRNTIIRYASDHQLAYWDLFSVTGGKGSARNWQKAGLLAKDGIHFKKSGYEFTGELLFQSVYNYYLNEYIHVNL